MARFDRPCMTVTCVGKMRIFNRIYIRILHVGTSAHPHFTPVTASYPCTVCMSYGVVRFWFWVTDRVQLGQLEFCSRFFFYFATHWTSPCFTDRECCLKPTAVIYIYLLLRRSSKQWTKSYSKTQHSTLITNQERNLYT